MKNAFWYNKNKNLISESPILKMENVWLRLDGYAIFFLNSGYYFLVNEKCYVDIAHK